MNKAVGFAGAGAGLGVGVGVGVGEGAGDAWPGLSEVATTSIVVLKTPVFPLEFTLT